MTAHQLRHSFANDLVEADMPVTSIQKLLGHRWLESTQTYVRGQRQAGAGRFLRGLRAAGGLAMNKQPQNTAEWYDRALAYILNKHLSRDIPWPQPTSAWPQENVAILERYAEWRLAGGASPHTTRTIYAPTAGQVLGLAHKPYTEFDLAAWCDSGLNTEFRRAYAFILARNLSAARTKVCRNALENFRKFLRQKRGLPEERKQQAFDVDPPHPGLARLAGSRS